MWPSILSEHCAHLLECLFYHDESLLINSAYTVFPIVEVSSTVFLIVEISSKSSFLLFFKFLNLFVQRIVYFQTK